MLLAKVCRWNLAERIRNVFVQWRRQPREELAGLSRGAFQDAQPLRPLLSVDSENLVPVCRFSAEWYHSSIFLQLRKRAATLGFPNCSQLRFLTIIEYQHYEQLPLAALMPARAKW